MEIDVTALRSRDPDMVARGLLALAVIGLVGAWVQMPAAPRPAPILDGAIPAKVRRAVAWRAPGAWFSAGDIAMAVGVERSQIAWTLRQLVDAGELEAKGTRNSRRYRRPVTA
ncbi:hypothetical protein, partial [Zavarzinia sp.]|uniref:hypothetical protein n=1 Tax=Zavarzinia sp. TaxID=2027920 RepID=UPI003BB774B4